jgi:hypothetical protein
VTVNTSTYDFHGVFRPLHFQPYQKYFELQEMHFQQGFWKYCVEPLNSI